MRIITKFFEWLAEIESRGTREQVTPLILSLLSLSIIFRVAYEQITGTKIELGFIALFAIFLLMIIISFFLLYSSFILPKNNIPLYEKLIRRQLDKRNQTKLGVFFIFLATIFFIGLTYLVLDFLQNFDPELIDYMWFVTSISITFFFTCWGIFLIKALRYKK